jgi:hypothetical protein
VHETMASSEVRRLHKLGPRKARIRDISISLFLVCTADALPHPYRAFFLHCARSLQGKRRRRRQFASP